MDFHETASVDETDPSVEVLFRPAGNYAAASSELQFPAPVV
jgi:hypothetical protein